MSGVLAASEVASLKNFINLQSVTESSSSSSSKFRLGGHTSLVDFYRDKIFAFDHKKNAVVTGSYRNLIASSSADTFKVDEEFKLTVKISFHVSELSLRPGSGDCCILVGHRGVVSMGFEYLGSSKLHIVHEALIGKQLYSEHPNLSVIQCKWLPTLTHKVIVVLNSDFFLRAYNTETNECLRVFCLGPPNSLPLMVKYNAEIDPETPVDFDFGIYFPKSKSWSIFVLATSGTISCIVLRLIGTTLRCLIETYGPIQRLDEDNGRTDEEFSCIRSSKQYPVVIVTGQDSGQIKHSVLLPINFEEDDTEEENMEDKLQKNEFALYTKERLNLNVSGNISKSPMQLILDPIYDERYICVHGGGAHLVTMKFLPEMLNFFNTDENSSLSTLSPSVCRLLLVWKFGDKGTIANKILGASYSVTQPQKLLFVLHDKRSVLYNMPHPNDEFHMSSENVDQHRQKKSNDTNNLFSQKDVMTCTRSLLRNSASQPFLCGDEEISISERSKVVQTAIQVKSEQMNGLEDASQYVLGYIHTLEAKSNEMKSLVKNVLENRGGLKIVAERLAEQYEERMEQDEILTRRLESILFRYHQCFPVITDQEKSWIKIMNGIKQETYAMKESVKKFTLRASQLESTDKSVQINLTPMQVRQIKEEIANQHHVLSSMITNLRQIHHKLSLG